LENPFAIAFYVLIYRNFPVNRLPIYRSGSVHKSTAPDIASRKWIQDHGLDNIGRFSAMGSTEGNEGQTRRTVPTLICER
jgi:hypothetical protein